MTEASHTATRQSLPDHLEWLADKIPAYGDYAKEAAHYLRQYANALLSEKALPSGMAMAMDQAGTVRDQIIEQCALAAEHQARIGYDGHGMYYDMGCNDAAKRIRALKNAAPNVETVGEPTGDPHPCDAVKSLPSAELCGTPRTDAQDQMIDQLIDERDRAQETIDRIYEVVMGESPEWTNLFGYREAVEAIEDKLNTAASATAPSAGASTTPRTDALIDDPMTEREMRLFDHARQLERDLAAAHAVLAENDRVARERAERIFGAASETVSATAATTCKGKNCGSTDPRWHSQECYAEHEAAYKGIK